MIERVRDWWRSHPYVRWLYPAVLLSIVATFTTAHFTGKGSILGYLSIFCLFLLAVRPGSSLHDATMERIGLYKKIVIVLVVLLVIATCVAPMDWLPIWNGEFPSHRNQYELMAEAILDGRIEFAYGDEDQVASLDDPYDPKAREESGVIFHHDHAFYKGHYYMYFGIVPVLLLFLPYRVITGQALTTFRATQVFVIFIIIGVFVLFRLLTKLFSKKLPFLAYLAMASAVSVMSVWFSTAQPALYCTAITAAIALEVWSLYFFIRAVWGEKKENRQILFALIGAALGALVFGCRPTIALANILVIPMLIVFLRQRKFSWKLLGKLVLAAMPYVIVGVALMWYNYVRFEDPFEFGQRYQLTVADQTKYATSLDFAMIKRLVKNVGKSLLGRPKLRATFPYIRFAGALLNFPMLLLSAVLIAPAVQKRLREHKLLLLVLTMFGAVVLITVMTILWTPYLLERYHMDIYFLLGIACFLIVGVWYDRRPSRRISSLVVIMSAYTLVCGFLFCVQSIGQYYPGLMAKIGEALLLGSSI